jgi:DNA polymerase elongation subunit (family B)
MEFRFLFLKKYRKGCRVQENLKTAKSDFLETDALTNLNNEGKYLKAGENLQYIITDYYRKRSKNSMAIPIELINERRTSYDVKRYIELLTEACNPVT